MSQEKRVIRARFWDSLREAYSAERTANAEKNKDFPPMVLDAYRKVAFCACITALALFIALES